MQILLEPLICILIILPLIYFGKKKESYKSEFTLIFALYFLMDSLVTVIPIQYPILNLFNLQMNWQGKVNSYILAFTFFFFYRKFPIDEYGFTLKQKENSHKYFLKILIGFTLFALIYSHLIERYSSEIENILFQLTMPSIVEEIVFRGILLGLLNQVFIKSFRIGKTYFGMGVIITSILFGLWHGLSIDTSLGFNLYWVPLIYTTVIGFILALIKERTGSILGPIILHIVINTIPNVIGYIY